MRAISTTPPPSGPITPAEEELLRLFRAMGQANKDQLLRLSRLQAADFARPALQVVKGGKMT